MTQTIYHDLQELNVPHNYYAISAPKLTITQAVMEGLAERELSIRKFAEQLNMNHPQILRITQGKNYEINTLLKVLDNLDLEIVIKKRER